MMSATHQPDEDGFTLMELLVAMALLALITAALLAALQSSPFMRRLSERIERQSAVDSGASHLRRVIEATRAIYRRVDDGSAELVFSGGSGSLRLVTVSDGRLELGGLYVVEFALDDSGAAGPANRTLLARRKLYRSTMPEDESSPTEAMSLLQGVQSLRFRYFGSPAPDQKPKWLDDWTGRNALPRAIEVDLEFVAGDRRQWTTLAVLLPVAF